MIQCESATLWSNLVKAGNIYFEFSIQENEDTQKSLPNFSRENLLKNFNVLMFMLGILQLEVNS